LAITGIVTAAIISLTFWRRERGRRKEGEEREGE